MDLKTRNRLSKEFIKAAHELKLIDLDGHKFLDFKKKVNSFISEIETEVKKAKKSRN